MPKLEAVTFKQLRALRSVAERGSITAAAEALRLTPPAVHTQIRGLEAAIGCRLLTGSGAGGATLSAEGIAVLEAQKAIDLRLQALAEHVRALRSGRTGLVVLGVVSTGKYFAPGLVARVSAEFPQIEIILRVGNRDAIIAALQNGTIDLAIMGRPPRSPAVTAHAIGPHPHVLIAASGHRLAGPAQIAARDILAERFIAREHGSGTRILMSRYLDRIGNGMPYHSVEMGTNETIKQAVMAGLGIALISQHTVTDELNSGRLVTLNGEGLPIVRQWYLLHRDDLEMTPARRRVFLMIEAMEGSFLPVLQPATEKTDAPQGGAG